MKIVFFGTHKFAATILEALLTEPSFEVALVITAPDKPAGRKQTLAQSQVKILAEKHGIMIDQPASLKSYRLSACLAGRQATSYQLGIVAQYGGIIPKHILDAPTHGILNVHPSLLPKYRGAAPIQTAIMNGDTETGVTIMKMDEGLDTGPILSQKKLTIGPDQTYREVEGKLAQLGAEALLEAIPKYLGDELKPMPQDDSQATYCKQLTRDDGRIDWHRSAQEIYNQYRGLTPWPGVWTTWNGKRLKLLRLSSPHIRLAEGSPRRASGSALTESGRLFIAASDQPIEIIELQLEGAKPMTAQTFLLGAKEFATSTLL